MARVAEAAGVWASGTHSEWVGVREVGTDTVQISVGFKSASLTPEQARTLARQLNRLARRVEKIQEGKKK